MKKFFAREFLWLLLTLVIAIPLGLLFLWLLGFTNEPVIISEQDKDYIVGLYLVGYIVSFIGVYLIRLMVMALKTLTAA